ncbi:MAG: hypothetical protein OSA95_05160, partial [Opitutales bacterium]|nr:hypothetical protein [Opitutales bacterium]
MIRILFFIGWFTLLWGCGDKDSSRQEVDGRSRVEPSQAGSSIPVRSFLDADGNLLIKDSALETALREITG